MREKTQSAFVLHSRPYRENQVIVDLLTESDGKVAALSYIGHSTKSSRKALLQPFLPLQVTLKGESTLKHLTRIEASAKSLTLKSNHLYSAFYMNELVVKLIGDNIQCETLFFSYKSGLAALAQQHTIESILRAFEQAILNELGVCFDFSIIFDRNEQSYYYLPDDGFIPAYTKLKQPCFNGEHLRAIAQQELSAADVQQTYKILMRQMINHLLEGKELNSRKLFKKTN
jgi:DNA repair protein RecO (recombination protein O)